MFVDRVPLILCVEKKLIGEHLTEILQSGTLHTEPNSVLCMLILLINICLKIFEGSKIWLPFRLFQCAYIG